MIRTSSVFHDYPHNHTQRIIEARTFIRKRQHGIASASFEDFFWRSSFLRHIMIVLLSRDQSIVCADAHL